MAVYWQSSGIHVVVGWHSIALVVHWHSVGSGVAKDSYNQILDFSPQWHFIDPQLIKEWKSKCWEWFFPVTGNLIFSSGRGLAQWHSSDRLATLCHWNQCPHFGQSCATQKLHPYYKTTAVADRQPKKVDHFTPEEAVTPSSSHLLKAKQGADNK